MGCGCKNVKKLDKKNGVKKKEGLTAKLIKVGLFSLTILLGLIITPIVLVIGLFNAFFRNGKPIMLPKFLTNHKKSVDGQKL